MAQRNWAWVGVGINAVCTIGMFLLGEPFAGCAWGGATIWSFLLAMHLQEEA